MLAYIKGILEIKTKGYIVVEAGGLGYKIFMPESTIASVGDIGDNVRIYTFMRVREDDVSLYGFLTNEELRMFELLLSVSGIGAKGALGILSNITPSQFALAVISNDVAILKKVPGIGPKTAQRAILELKDKLKKEQEISLAEGEEASSIEKAIKEDEKVSEAISALQVLGYSKREIVEALQTIEVTSLPVEDIIKKGLNNLAKRV